MMSVVDDWTISNNLERNTMLNIAKCGRNLSFSCYMSSMNTCLFYTCTYLHYFYNNWHQRSKRKLIYNYVYNFCDFENSPNYEITFFLQLFSAVFVAFLNSTVNSFVSTLLLHVCAQLINLRERLNNVIDELANRSISTLKFKEDLAAIVVRHEHLIRYTRRRIYPACDL